MRAENWRLLLIERVAQRALINDINHNSPQLAAPSAMPAAKSVNDWSITAPILPIGSIALHARTFICEIMCNGQVRCKKFRPTIREVDYH